MMRYGISGVEACALRGLYIYIDVCIYIYIYIYIEDWKLNP